MYIQYSLGENAQWRMPIILIGFGVGLPLFIVPFCDWSASPNTELSEEEYAQTNLDGGFYLWVLVKSLVEIVGIQMVVAMENNHITRLLN